jgi:hypothetical protein
LYGKNKIFQAYKVHGANSTGRFPRLKSQIQREKQWENAKDPKQNEKGTDKNIRRQLG